MTEFENSILTFMRKMSKRLDTIDKRLERVENDMAKT